MDEEETVEEECLTLLGWSVEEVAQSTLEEMQQALHDYSSSSSSPPTPSTSFVPTTFYSNPTFVSTDLVQRINCLKKRISLQDRLMKSGGAGTDDSSKFKQGMETDNRLLVEDTTSLLDRLKVIETRLVQKKQSLEVVDDLLKFTHKVQGLAICLSRDTQHKKDIIEDMNLLHMELNILLNVAT
jgi:hypothetical protein